MSREIPIAKQSADGSYAIRCAFCEGTGVFPETACGCDQIETEPCSVCGGKGLVSFRTDPAFLIQCAYCTGTGKAWDDSGRFMGDPCPICNGFGHTTPARSEREDLDQEVTATWALMHPSIVKVARPRFEAGHFADSVEAALKEVNRTVRDIVKSQRGQERDGAHLMEFAFSVDNPVLLLGDLSTESGRNVQKGYLQIFSGSMTAIRNPKAHDNLEIGRTRAVHHLFLASLLMCKITEDSIAESSTATDS